MMTHDTIVAVIGYAQAHCLLMPEDVFAIDCWLDGETLLRLSAVSDIPVTRLIMGPISQDECDCLPGWGEVLADEVEARAAA